MLDAQGGLCKLCGRPPSPHQALAPDHDHKTGEVRGLLCHECNRLIVGTLDHYGPARRNRVIDRLASYYGSTCRAELWVCYCGAVPPLGPDFPHDDCDGGRPLASQ